MIKTISFHGLQPGPRLLILGGVHGNEICGPAAIAEILPRLESGEIAIARGSVTIIPVCNPEAYRQDKRFIEHNLNRAMRRHKEPKLYEEKLMNVLCPYLENCDLVLDIHSYTAGGPAFSFRGNDEYKDAEEAFAETLGIDQLIYGWGEAYRSHGDSKDDESVGTTEYARQFSAKAAITIECGQHRDPNAVPVAVRAILGALAYSGVTNSIKPLPLVKLRKSRIRDVVFKERDGRFLQPLHHLQMVQAGTELARYDDGMVIKASYDARLIMPKEDTAIGHEWLYMAVDES